MDQTAEKKFVVKFWNFAKNEHFHLITKLTLAAQKDVTTKKLLADCFKTLADSPKTQLLGARAISTCWLFWGFEQLSSTTYWGSMQLVHFNENHSLKHSTFSFTQW